MPNDDFTEKLQQLLDEMREELEYTLLEDLGVAQKEEKDVNRKEVRQENMMEDADACDEAVVASLEYWELATQVQILSMFGDVPEDVESMANQLESRIKRLIEECSDESKINRANINVREAEKRLNNARKMSESLGKDNRNQMSIKDLLEELEEISKEK
ncbi:hypothetical protein ACK3SF_03085 [Candidatus Nanosalina sp. VS9-1]|uniref:hypothetical protein n=1 Tax=Candidatus Nanosalina sp. VS9-1 TaxID=3388566 RepID=UPI0039E14194